MGLAIGDIVELVGPDRAVFFFLVQFLGQALGDFDVVIGIGVGHSRNFHQLSAAQPQHLLFFLGLGLGNNDYGSIAARIPDQGEANTGIARGALDEDTARFQSSFVFGVADDRQCRAVLDRTAGVEKLGLGEDVAARCF